MATTSASIGNTDKFGDLRRRLVFLLLALVVYRVGAHIPVPGINPDQLQQLFKGQQGGILSLFNMFSGGALSRFTVFALGIMPYISASIIMQLLTYVLPSLEQLKKEAKQVVARSRNTHASAPWAWRCSSPWALPWHWKPLLVWSMCQALAFA